MTVHYMNELIAARDNVNLVPAIDFDIATQGFRVAKHSKQARLFPFFGAHCLTAPGDDAASCAAFVILAGVTVGSVEVGLRSAQIPFGVAGDVGRAARLAAGTRA